jgi:ribonuclease BN (tRNA processing enzyme)
MKLLILGTSGYHPTEHRQTACLMLPEAGIVLDAGTGFFRIRNHLATPTLDIFLSHAHLDHSVGLTFMLSAIHQKDVRRVTVHGEAAKLAVIREHLLNDLLFPAPLPCEWRGLPESGSASLTLAGEKISWFPVVHPGGAVGYRLDWPDRSMAYVTDTTAAADADYVQKIRGVDLLVHECNFRDDQEEWAIKTGHSCTTAVAQVARAAAVKRLVLVHLDSLAPNEDPVDLASARRIFPETEVAEDGMVVEF